MMNTLTVFTPTYNRSDLLPRGYQALCRQSNHDFCWLIIDDGSTDGTRELVSSWIKDDRLFINENEFEGYSKDAEWLKIHYCYKENGGLHTGYNKAIELMKTEICVCIDSDDYMPDDAVDTIHEKWEICKQKGYIGIIGRDYYLNNQPIGGPLPKIETSYIIELDNKYKHSGDKKIVMKVDLLKKVAPQPTFNGEKNFNPIYMMLQLDQFGKFLLLEKNLCYVDYQDGGMAANIYKQYVNSANSFCALRCLCTSLPHTNIKFRIKNVLHLTSSVFLAHDFSWLQKCKYPTLAYMMLPLGYMLSKYIRKKANY